MTEVSDTIMTTHAIRSTAMDSAVLLNTTFGHYDITELFQENQQLFHSVPNHDDTSYVPYHIVYDVMRGVHQKKFYHVNNNIQRLRILTEEYLDSEINNDVITLRMMGRFPGKQVEGLSVALHGIMLHSDTESTVAGAPIDVMMNVILAWLGYHELLGRYLQFLEARLVHYDGTINTFAKLLRIHTMASFGAALQSAQIHETPWQWQAPLFADMLLQQLEHADNLATILQAELSCKNN